MLLDTLKAAYNFHGAPPEFPGRDPHHWAIHRDAAEYGATLHVMTEKVDAGPILRVCRFPMPAWTDPYELSRDTETVLEMMFARYLPALIDGSLEPIGETWGPTKTTRADAVKMRGKRGFETF